MKLRNMISMLSVALLLATACTEDEVINREDTTEGGVTLKLTTEGIVTKAADDVASDYEHATPAELKIYNAAIAFFKGEERVGFKYATFPEGVATDTDDSGKAYYTVENILVQGGSDIEVLVLANSSLSEDVIKAVSSKTGFKQLEETVTGNTFNPEKLVKFGGKAGLSIKKGEAITLDESIVLTQLAARIDLSFAVKEPGAEEMGVSSWSFNATKVQIANVALKSRAFMDTEGTAVNILDKEGSISKQFTLWESSTEKASKFCFYTYEKNFANQANPITITVNGTLFLNGEAQGESREYTLKFNPVKNGDICKTNGIVHGNLYEVVGSIDAKTRSMSFSWTLSPWKVRERNVTVNIIQPAFLVIADLNMTMPNITEISTAFQSSSKIQVIGDVVVTNGKEPDKDKEDYRKLKVYIYSIEGDKKVNLKKEWSGNNSGTLKIESELPINFVPKYITFTVKNIEGIEQKIVVDQYPPLYITNYLSQNEKVTAGSGQVNRDMYIFKSLIADYSGIENPTDVKEKWGWIDNKYYEHLGKPETRLKKGKDMAEYIRSYAVLGYPRTTNKLFKEVYSKEDGVDKNGWNGYNYEKGVFINGSVPCTSTESEEADNNYRISPCFILASQNGANSGMTDDKAREFCAGYIEHDTDGNLSSHTYGSWRVPTKAELYLIDILQNTEACDVKKILEGRFYKCAVPSTVDFMDPRVNKEDDGTRAVRCVRDIKDFKY